MKAATRGDSGAVLVFLVVLFPVLIGLVAFAVDISRAHLSKEQSRALARLLALSVIEQFYDSEVHGGQYPDLQQRFESAKNRANAVAKRHQLMSAPDEAFKPLVYPWESQDPDAEGGIIIPGNYYFTDPGDEGPQDPCTGDYPCFVPLVSAGASPDFAAGDLAVNSFRLEVTFVSRYQTSFSKASFGISFIKPSPSAATALTVPRHVVFLIDKSLSSTAQTHVYAPTVSQKGETPPGDPPASRGGLYAFAVEKPGDAITIPADGAADVPSRYSGCTAAEDLSDACQWRLLRHYNVFTGDFDGNGLTRGAAPSGWEGGTHHFYDDYEKIGVFQYPAQYDSQYPHPDLNKNFSDNHAPASLNAYKSDGESYLIERETSPDPDNPRFAEPLKSIFDGLHSSLSQFAARRNSGDKAGIVFFDTRLQWTGVIPLTGDIKYLIDLADIQGLSGAALEDHLRRIKQLAFFPGRERNTNILLATAEAAEQLLNDPLRRDANVPTSGSIIYIGDFLSNCVAYPDESDPVAFFRSSCNGGECDLICRDPSGSQGPCSPSGPSYAKGTIPFRCSNDFLHFDRSVRQISTYAYNKLFLRQISFNTIIIGDHVGPHVLDVEMTDAGGQTKCLTDAEARANRLDYVLGGDEDGSFYSDMQGTARRTWAQAFIDTSAVPFYQAVAEAYNVVRLTGGIFLPILSPEPPGGGACQIQDDLSQYCRSGYGSAAPYRRKVDRKCRDQSGQILDALNEIIKSDSPYKIVEAD